MKFVFAVLTTISLTYANASENPKATSTCGLYQVEDYTDRVLYSITNNTNGQSNFTITNPGTTVVRNMVRGLCYCVSGIVRPDPEFDGDDNFKLLTIDNIEGPPFYNCLKSTPN